MMWLLKNTATHRIQDSV
jgi:hypothetical protein